MIRGASLPNKNPPISAAIYGCESLKLTRAEKAFFRKQNPVGFILFKRNIADPKQVKALVKEMKACVSHTMPLILIDQEGGRVARLGAPHWRKAPPAGDIAALSAKKADRAMHMHYRLIAAELFALGINVDCAPMLDVPAPGCDAIIGDRALGTTPKQIIRLGKVSAKALLEGGVLPVIKHIPGHGRATADSHKTLPVVAASKASLAKTDFAPFKALNDQPLGMTAHITYTALDKKNCATLSPKIIGIIRKDIGFEGLLMTDDLSMHALSGDFADRTKESIAAGCDIVLHCNGKMDEMKAIAEACPALSKEGLTRLKRAWKMLKKPKTFDARKGLKEFTALMGS